MRQLIKYFITYPITGNVLMGMIFIFGWFGLQSMKANFFPEVRTKSVQIQVTYPGASPEEIEEGVVNKIEDNLKGITGIDRVMSTSNENSALITVDSEEGADIEQIYQDIRNAVDRVSSFPVGMEPVVIFKKERIDFAISFAISGPVDLRLLKQIARDMEDDLLQEPGISKIEIQGYPAEEIEIALNESQLRSYGLTFAQIAATLRNTNLLLAAGTLKEPREELFIRVDQKKYTAAELKDIILVAKADGGIIRLGDVASVKEIWADKPAKSFLNGNPSVIVTVNNTSNEDILFISKHVRNYVDEFNKKGGEVLATVIRDRSITISQRIDLLVSNGFWGILLVLLLLSMFLNIRLSLWVALSIPVSFFGMFIIGSLTGLTINVMSLFGMILVVGILVDDGIVISENIYQHYERGAKPLDAAINGTMEVLPAVISAIFTTVVGFISFFFMSGRMSDFVVDMAYVVILTLLISLIEAAFILPAHVAHSKALTIKPTHKGFQFKLNQIILNFRDRYYVPLLRFCLQNVTVVLLFFVVSLLVSFAAIKGGIVKTTFFPHIESDNLSATIEMPSGTREDITDSIMQTVERKVWVINEKLKKNRSDDKDIILHIERKIGPGSHQGNLNIILMDAEARNLQSFVISNLLREEVGPILGADKVSYGSRVPFGKPISISILSKRIEDLEKAQSEIKEGLKEMGKVKDILDNSQQGIREIEIKLKDKASLLGLNLAEVVTQVRHGFYGIEVQRLQRGEDEVKIWARFALEERNSINKLETMRIRTASGQEIPLSEIAHLSFGRGLLAINHLDGKREMKIEADMADPNESATDIIAELKEKIMAPVLARYPSIRASYEGQARESGKTADSGKAVMPVILLIMISIVVLTFRSFGQALLVFLLIPFGFIGVIWGHWTHGMAISILSVYGIIALIGIMINDALVLVTTFNLGLKQGKPFLEALHDAAVSRFRAIILTSLTTIAGLAPMILQKSFQAQFLIPMAVSVAYGLLMATLVTLIILPVVLLLLNRFRIYMKWLWEGQKPGHEIVEPAIKEMNFQNEKEAK